MITIDTNPPPRTLIQFGFIWMGFFALFGAAAWFRADNQTLAGVLWTLAVLVPVAGWTVPAFMRLVFVGMSFAAWPIGFVVTHVILALVFYLVLTPIGLIMRLVGYDPIVRSLDREAGSYWVERPSGPAESSRYFRQS